MAKNPEEVEALLTQAQSAALPLLAAGMKKQDAATAAGVCPQTVSEWLRQSHFSSALQAKRRELAALAGKRLAEATNAALSTVLELMESGAEATRLKAATFVLERMLLVQSHAEMSPEQEQHAQEAAEIRDFWRRVMNDDVEDPGSTPAPNDGQPS